MDVKLDIIADQIIEEKILMPVPQKWIIENTEAYKKLKF